MSIPLYVFVIPETDSVSDSSQGNKRCEERRFQQDLVSNDQDSEGSFPAPAPATVESQEQEKRDGMGLM